MSRSMGTRCTAKETNDIMTEQIERVEDSEPADTGTRERPGYDARAAQERWQAFWEADKTFVPKDDGSAERRYMLDMFPYPSGDLHMGHAEAFVMGDHRARRPSCRVDVREHRNAGDFLPALRAELRLVPPTAHL
jgi:valyl-tRNA synthetase